MPHHQIVDQSQAFRSERDSTPTGIAPEVTIVVWASSPGLKAYGAPARRNDARMSKSPSLSSASAKHPAKFVVQRPSKAMYSANDGHW
jgi:hypothetical protein